MQVVRIRPIALALCAVALTVAHLSAQAKVSKADATRFEAKLAQIQKNAETPRKGNAMRSTQITDGEVNSYLKFISKDVPVGIVDPTLQGEGNGRISGRAIVDLDAVRTSKKRGWSDPLGYLLMGKLPITAVGTLTTAKGVGRFNLESAELSGVTIPKTLVQELLSYYSKTPQTPNGINMDDPFQLPSAIQEIKVGKGSAVIVQ